uniref:DUF2807 domain-containing protein n=1 Tax=Klebsiella pneumoniae TaxID=573 RepID=A0A9J6S632_KLEPN|nr:DUF2807 domain-containing protein [Klebsiella pneumoniae]
MNTSCSLNLMADAADYSDWKRANGYQKEERPIQATRQVVIKGAWPVVIFRGSKLQLVVAARTGTGLKYIETYIDGQNLVVRQKGNAVIRTGNHLSVSGSGNIVSAGDVYERGDISISVTGNGNIIAGGVFRSQRKLISTETMVREEWADLSDVIIGISVPRIPDVVLQGSSDLTLCNIKQSSLAISIQGSGDVKATGSVERLRVDVDGSGDVNADQLMSLSAEVHVAGSGDVRTWVCESMKASVKGSGDIVVRGNPKERDCSVVGSGEIRFR